MAAKKSTSFPKSVDAIRVGVEKQDPYTLHGLLRKRFARNPNTVNNVKDVWECDLMHVKAYAKYNDNHRYNLPVIDVFLKFLHLVPL